MNSTERDTHEKEGQIIAAHAERAIHAHARARGKTEADQRQRRIVARASMLRQIDAAQLRDQSADASEE